MPGKIFCLQQYFPRDEEIVYRYMPYYKFEDLASSKELYLSRGDQFDKGDSREGNETKSGKKLRRVVHDMEYTENHDWEFTKFGCPFFLFSIKRKGEFANENELRIIYGEGKGCIDGSQLYNVQEINDIKVRIPIDLSIFISEIVLSPKSTISVFNKVQKISKKAGLHVPIVRSSLI